MNQNQNPYSASEAPKAAASYFKFSHSRAINFVFENPNWFTNILLVLVCMIIPLVGPIVVYGYQMEMIECLHRERGRRYPDFDFNRFSDYLSRGIWVFLVALVLNLIAIPLVWIVMFGGMGLIGVTVSGLGPDVGPWSLFATVPLFIVSLMGVWIAMAVVAAPSVLRSGLTQDFGQGFNFGFIAEFAGNTWKQITLSTLFMVVFGFAVSLAGLVAFCVGVYVAMAYLTLVMTHLGWQTYELHLSKGGSPIPIKPSMARPGYMPPQPPVKPQSPHRPY